jgi:DNA polymerase gamma 1
MLEMSTSYLPVNRNWQRYLQESEDTYRDSENELTQSLKREADRASHMMTDKSYEKDPWLWDLDWSTKPLKVKKTSVPKKKKSAAVIPSINNEEPENQTNKEDNDDEILEIQKLKCQFQELFNTKELLFKRNSFLPGY